MFRVAFHCASCCDYVINIDTPPAGLRALDAARAALGPDIARVERPLGFYQFDITCDVTEAQARRAAHLFADSFGASVCARKGALNGCVRYRWRRHRDDASLAVLEYEIDRQAAVEDWLAAGAPSEWLPPEEGPAEAA